MPRSAARTIALVILAATLICGVAASAGAWRLHRKSPTPAALHLDDYFSMEGWPGIQAGTRYLISAFPLFLTLALLLRERPRLHQGLVAVSAVGLVLLSWGFGRELYLS